MTPASRSMHRSAASVSVSAMEGESPMAKRLREHMCDKCGEPIKGAPLKMGRKFYHPVCPDVARERAWEDALFGLFEEE